MVNSIKKGKGFEREVANMLTRETGIQFHRVPQSGAFASVNKSEDPRFDGDIFTEHPDFQHLVIECKSYSKFELNDLFNEKSNLNKWITQCITESKGKHWMLFIKANRKGMFMVTDNNIPEFIHVDLEKFINSLKKIEFCIDGNLYMLFKIK